MQLTRVLGVAFERMDRVRQVAAIDFSPRLPPWSGLRRPTTPVQRLRAAATRIGPLRGGTRGRRIFYAGVAALWHLKAPWHALQGVIRSGRGVRNAGGPTPVRQFFHALSAAFRWNVSPKTYYQFRLWDPTCGLSPATVAQNGELGVHLYWANRELDIGVVANKARFAEVCGKHSIPVARTVRVVGGAGLSAPGQPIFPMGPLFVKPLAGQQGDGAERWDYDADTRCWVRGGLRLDEPQLLAHIDELRLGTTYLVQECLVNHPELVALCGSTLSTFRVVTWLGQGGPPRVACVALKLGRAGSDVDNLHAGGMVCAVDEQSGRLAGGLSDQVFAQVVVHPDTGAAVAGRCLTTHRAVIDLAVRAHREVPGLPWSVGWDIASTPGGPVLVEANSLWGADLPQMAGRGPLPTSLVEECLARSGCDQPAPAPRV